MRLTLVFCWTLFGGLGSFAWARGAMPLLDDFESEPTRWRCVGGEEFPGARGALERDNEQCGEGQWSLRLSADFAEGGAYVGAWREMGDVEAPWLTGIRLSVRSRNVTEIGVRLSDSTGQCHQAKGVGVQADGAWREVELRLADLVGSESWGGAADGRWHGPIAGFGINIGIDGLAEGEAGDLWLDDIRLITSDDPPGEATVAAAEPSRAECRPGFGAYLTHRWEGRDLGADYSVFVHVMDGDGRMVFQADHSPPVPTAAWDGPVEYRRALVVPPETPEGQYRVVVGLYASDGRGGWVNHVLAAGPGAVLSEDSRAAEVAVITVDREAPPPPLGPVTLDLEDYRLTFAEEFDGPLDVSAWGPGTRWIAHTPYAGDFGDAGFADPEEGFPFMIEDGALRIEARKTENGWRSGLLSSVDPKGEGFSQRYGYFEMRAKLPPGKGTWPAFWLLGVDGLKDRSRTNPEIDVVEQYGVNPNVLHNTVHLWRPDGGHWADGAPHLVEGMTEGFHTYGTMITEEHIVFYYDGVELRRAPTPPEARAPLYILVNLALGGGWRIDETPSPSFLYVDYVRAYGR